MKIRSVLFGAALIVSTAVITSAVMSQDAKPGGQPPAMTPEQEAMMQKCIEAGTPGENHKILAAKVGKWNGTGKFWMEPGGQPMENNFSAEYKSLYEGRYFTETVEGPGMMGEGTFMGQGTCGYDNVTKKFFFTWIDSMSTGLMDGTGTYNAGNKTFTYNTEHSCPVTGKRVTGRTVETWKGNDQILVESYGPHPETGKEFKMMEITYTRAK
jgi:hypothetical protein